MKIKVIANVSELVRRVTFEPSEFGLTDDEWYALTDREKNAKIQSAIDSIEPPCWIVDEITEVK